MFEIITSLFGDFFNSFFAGFGQVWDLLVFILNFWWIYTPIILYQALKAFYMDKINGDFLSQWEWVNLEIVLQKELEKTPKSMEQVFNALHGIHKSLDFQDTYLKGAIQEYYSLEMISIDGDVHFIIRTLKQFRSLVESAIFAQFADVEIVEVDDYASKVDQSEIGKSFNIWGTDLAEVKSDVYPLRTYTYFLEPDAPGMIIDPLSQITEVMSSTKPGEQIWIQVLASPSMGDLQARAKGEIDKMLGKEPPPSKTIVDKIFSPLLLILSFGIIKGQEAAAKADSPIPPLQKLTPGQTDVLKEIENKMTKLTYVCKVRFMYIATNEVFNGAIISGIMGGFKQLQNSSSNGLKPDSHSKTSQKFLLNAKSKQHFRKNKILEYYVKRKLNSPKYTLSVEELATLFHFPGQAVTANSLRRIQSKKATPPPSLPIIEG